MATIDEKVKAEARMWIDSLERKWRLQILSKRYRVNPTTGERKEMPLRIRRFAEGIPYACVDEALKYLLSLAPYKDIVYNGMLLEGEYLPTVTTWKRDDQDVVNGTSRTDGTYTLIQDLIDRRYLDQYSVASARSCTEEVVTDWTWDSSDIGDIPEDNPLQGVTYAVQSVSRNEDGTFNYALVKRTALTQHTPRVTTKVTADETIETESWDNLYGEPPDFMDDKGLSVPVPVAGYTLVPGTRTEVQVTKNDDCTYKVQVVYVTDGADRVDPTYLGDTSCLQDTEYEYHWREAEVLDIGAARQQGVTKAVQNLRREDDGTYSYVVVTRRALTRDTGDVLQTSSATETIHVRTVYNVYGSSDGWMMYTAAGGLQAMSPAIPVPSNGAPDGRVDVQVTRNEDCTYRVQVTKTKSVSQCHDRETTATIFEGQVVQRCIGEASALTDVSKSEGDKDGVVETHESQQQPDGTYANRTTVKTEQSVPRSSVTKSVNRRGTRITTVDVNQPSEPDMSSVGVGGSVKFERTPGGLYNNTTVEWDKSEQQRVGVFCTEDVFHHQHDVTKSGLPDMPGYESDADDLELRKASGKGGRVLSKRTEMDDEGSISQTTSKHQEIFAPLAEESWRVGPYGVVHTVKHRNVDPIAHPDHFGSAPAAGVFDRSKIGSELVRAETPGGWYDVTTSEVSRAAASRVGIGCSKDVFLHTDTTVSSAQALPDGQDSHVERAGVEAVGSEDDLGSGDDRRRGVYRSRDARVNTDGTISVTDTVNVEIPAVNAQVQDDANAFVITHINVDRNIAGPFNFADPSTRGSLDPSTHVITKRTFSKNKGGSYDVTTETRTPRFRWWSHLTDTNWRWAKTFSFRNATADQVKAIYRAAIRELNFKMTGSEESPFAHGYEAVESNSSFLEGDS